MLWVPLIEYTSLVGPHLPLSHCIEIAIIKYSCSVCVTRKPPCDKPETVHSLRGRTDPGPLLLLYIYI